MQRKDVHVIVIGSNPFVRLQQATSLAEHMVREFGMSEKVGLRYYTRPEGGLVVVNDNSPQTAEAIDGEVNRILRVSSPSNRL